MHRLTILILATLLTGCAFADAALVEAETGLVVAESSQIETQSDADTITALLTTNQAAIDALVSELAAGRADRQATEVIYLELLAEQAALVEQLAEQLAEQSEPQTSPLTVALVALLLGVGGYVLWRNRRRVEFTVALGPGAQPAAMLAPGEPWRVDVEERVREVVEV